MRLTVVSKEDRMRLLAFAIYLIEISNINADNVLFYSKIALLNFHDALEFLFDLILEDTACVLRGSRILFHDYV